MRLIRHYKKEKPELEKLMGVIEVLRSVAKERDRGYGRTGGAVREKQSHKEGMRTAHAGGEMGGVGEMKLEMSKPQFAVEVDPHKITPMTEKILGRSGGVDQ